MPSHIEATADEPDTAGVSQANQKKTQQTARRDTDSQAQAAARLGVTQPRLNDLLRGRLDRFNVDALIALAERAGLAVEMRIAHAAE
jgi:predicted XRE-type DNA-binding protein